MARPGDCVGHRDWAYDGDAGGRVDEAGHGDRRYTVLRPPSTIRTHVYLYRLIRKAESSLPYAQHWLVRALHSGMRPEGCRMRAPSPCFHQPTAMSRTADAASIARGSDISGAPAWTSGHGMCGAFVGPDASLLVAGFSWLYVLQPDPEHAGQHRAGEPSRSGAGHLVHDAQPDRCHLSSITVKMTLVTYKFDVPPSMHSGSRDQRRAPLARRARNRRRDAFPYPKIRKR